MPDWCLCWFLLRCFHNPLSRHLRLFSSCVVTQWHFQYLIHLMHSSLNLLKQLGQGQFEITSRKCETSSIGPSKLLSYALRHFTAMCCFYYMKREGLSYKKTPSGYFKVWQAEGTNAGKAESESGSCSATSGQAAAVSGSVGHCWAGGDQCLLQDELRTCGGLDQTL